MLLQVVYLARILRSGSNKLLKYFVLGGTTYADVALILVVLSLHIFVLAVRLLLARLNLGRLLTDIA